MHSKNHPPSRGTPPLWPKPSLLPRSRDFSNFQWLFSSRPEPAASRLSPRLVQTQPGAARGSDAFPGVMQPLLPSWQRCAQAAGEQPIWPSFLRDRHFYSWQGYPQDQLSQTGWERLDLRAPLAVHSRHGAACPCRLSGTARVLQHPGLPQIRQNDVTCLPQDGRGRKPSSTARLRGAATPRAPAPGGWRRKKRRRRVQGR